MSDLEERSEYSDIFFTTSDSKLLRSLLILLFSHLLGCYAGFESISK